MNFVKEVFKGRIAVTPMEACAAVFGWPSASAHTRLYLHRNPQRKDSRPFPFKLIEIDGKDMVSVAELERVVNGVPAKPKKKLGAPTKRQRLEKAAATASNVVSI